MSHPRVPQGMGPSVTGPAAAVAELARAIQQGQYPWWYPSNAKDLQIDYAVLGANWEPLAASDTEPRDINVPGDTAFCVLSATMVETDTANTTFLQEFPLLANIFDSGQRQLSNTPIHASNWFGSAQLPKYWDVPKIYAPNTGITIELQNLEAVARNVRVALHGFKIFQYRP